MKKLAFLGILLLAVRAEAIDVDRAVSFTAPAASLTMPFDATPDPDGSPKISFLRISNVGGSSDPDALGEVPQVELHVAAWDEICDHVADFSICATLNSTVIVDTSSAQAGIYDPERGVVSIGPKFNLTGKRGTITATAFQTNRDCRPESSDTIVDDALMGSWSIANLSTSATFGGNAWGHGLDESASYVELIEPGRDLAEIFLGTFNPAEVENLVLGIGLRENAGKRPGELGPISDVVRADSQVCVPTEVCPSRPDIRASCFFVSRLDDPQVETIGSSGFFVLRNIGTEEDGVVVPIGSTANAVGDATMVYAVNGETIGDPVGMGTDVDAYYTLTPIVAATPSPEPTPFSCEGFECPEGQEPHQTLILINDGPEPICECRPLPSATPAPTATPTSTQSPEPTPVATPTAEPTPSPEPSEAPVS